MQSFPNSLGLLSIVLIWLLIPSQSSPYFSNTSLFLSVESKTKYLFQFFSSMCPSALPTIKYQGFTLLILSQSVIFLIVMYQI